jgi:hypothetical protein
MSDASDRKRSFEPLIPILHRFSQENGMTLQYETGQNPWTDPQYQLTWVNSNSQRCSIYVTLMRARDSDFHVHLLCWGTQGLALRRDWNLVHGDPGVMREILNEARTSAERDTAG